MRIVELGDCSIVIMKDSSDSFTFSVGSIYRLSKETGRPIKVIKITEDCQSESRCETSSESVYTAGRLILFFKNDITFLFQLHDRVILTIDFKKQHGKFK